MAKTIMFCTCLADKDCDLTVKQNTDDAVMQSLQVDSKTLGRKLKVS